MPDPGPRAWLLGAVLATLALAPAAGLAQSTNLVLLKTAGSASIDAGEEAGFSITVHNVGLSTAIGVTLTDPLPGGLVWSRTNFSACTIANATLVCNFGNLTAGASVNVQISASTTSANCASPIVNIANAFAANAQNVGAAAAVTVRCPDLDLEITPDATPFRAGQPIGLTLGVTNRGTGATQLLRLRAHLPKMNGLVWTQSPSRGCALTPQTSDFLLECGFSPELALGQSASVHVTAATTAISFFGDPTVGPFDATATALNDGGAGEQIDSLSFPARYPGDSDGDGTVGIADVFFLISYLFAGGPPPP